MGLGYGLGWVELGWVGLGWLEVVAEFEGKKKCCSFFPTGRKFLQSRNIEENILEFHQVDCLLIREVFIIQKLGFVHFKS